MQFFREDLFRFLCGRRFLFVEFGARRQLDFPKNILFRPVVFLRRRLFRFEGRSQFFVRERKLFGRFEFCGCFRRQDRCRF